MKINKRLLYLYVLFSIIGCNLILNYGFSNFGIYIGILVPLNQIVVLYGIYRLLLKRKISRKFTALLLLIAYAYIRLICDIIIYNKGVFALRDATNYMDMWYVMIIYNELENAEREGINVRKVIENFMNIVFTIALIYYFTQYMPGKSFIKSLSFSYRGQQGMIKLLGYYSAIKLWLIAYSIYCIYRLSSEIYLNKNIRKKYIIDIIVIFLFLSLSLGRTFIIGILFIIIYIIFTKSQKKFAWIQKKIIIIIFIFLIVVLLGYAFNWQIVTSKISEFIHLVLSIVGKGDNLSKIGGVYQRIEWFKTIFYKALNNLRVLMFGQGFGVPLTNFYSGSNTLVREPHNSFISVFARLGIIGEILWIALFVKIWKVMSYEFKYKTNKQCIFTMAMLILTVVMANTEPFFEQSYCAIPFYSFIGIALYERKM